MVRNISASPEEEEILATCRKEDFFLLRCSVEFGCAGLLESLSLRLIWNCKQACLGEDLRSDVRKTNVFLSPVPPIRACC